MGKLEQLLPEEWKRSAHVSGDELVLAYPHALGAINIAKENLIAVLGVEVFKVVKDKFLTVDYSCYDRDISASRDWKTHAEAINAEAEKWINANRYLENHGYILTSASEQELIEAKKLIGTPQGKCRASKIHNFFR